MVAELRCRTGVVQDRHSVERGRAGDDIDVVLAHVASIMLDHAELAAGIRRQVVRNRQLVRDLLDRELVVYVDK